MEFDSGFLLLLYEFPYVRRHITVNKMCCQYWYQLLPSGLEGYSLFILTLVGMGDPQNSGKMPM